MIFFDHTISERNENLIQFTAYENKTNEGECLLDLRYDDAEVTFISYNQNKPYIAEGLIRAAFNYAANKGFYMGKCCCEYAVSVLENMNFENRNGLYINDIPSILVGKCCCKNKQSID